MTGAWEAFRQEAFGEPYMVWHDGPDFTEVRDRFRTDPTAVLRLLAEGLALNDDVAAETLRQIEATDETREEVVAMLRAALPSSYGDCETEIATSLFHLTGDASLAGHVAGVLASGQHWGVRIDAAIRLREFPPTPDLVTVAVAGVRDPEYLVRYHCATTLMRWAGRTEDVSDTAYFPLISGDGNPSSWATAAEQLAAAVPT